MTGTDIFSVVVAIAIIFVAVTIACAAWATAIEREHNGAYRMPRAEMRKHKANRLDLRKSLRRPS